VPGGATRTPPGYAGSGATVLDPDIVFEATEIPTMEGLVAAGFGVAVVPVQSDGGDPKTVHVALSNAGAKREVGLVWDRDRELPPAADRFARFLGGA